jgi:hypothetical protein
MLWSHHTNERSIMSIEVGHYVYDTTRHNFNMHFAGEVVGVSAEEASVKRLHAGKLGSIWRAPLRDLVRIGHPDKVEVGDWVEGDSNYRDRPNLNFSGVVMSLPTGPGDKYAGMVRRHAGHSTIAGTWFLHNALIEGRETYGVRNLRIVKKWDAIEDAPIEGDNQTSEFSAQLVVEKVFEWGGCDDGKYTWLEAVGLPRRVAGAIRNPQRAYREGDIVRLTNKWDIGRLEEWSVGRLYVVEGTHDEGENSALIKDDRGDVALLNFGHLELVQAALGAEEAKPPTIPDTFTKEHVIIETFNTAHGEASRTREQRVEWLASIGITEAEVDEVIPKGRAYKKGDIVRFTAPSTPFFTLGRFYVVEEDARVATEGPCVSGNGSSLSCARVAASFELVQAVDA